jgi:hypothetical protein
VTAQAVSRPVNHTGQHSANRRSSTRHPCNLEALVRHAVAGEQEKCWPAVIRDISKGGIGLILNRPFEPGMVLTFELHTRDRSFSRTVLVCAVRSEPLGREEWLVGCTFASKISEQEIENLIAVVDVNQKADQATQKNGKPEEPKSGRKLSRKQASAIAALLDSESLAPAAAAARVSERTVTTWLASPEFRNALDRARQDLLKSSLTKLCRLSGEAATLLEKHLKCGQPAVEVQAAGEILRLVMSFQKRRNTKLKLGLS